MTAVAATKTNDPRRPLIAKVKIGQKALGWGDDLYRDILEARYDKRSATKLSYAQLDDLLGHMKDSGFKPTSAKSRSQGANPRGARPAAQSAHARKIRALWLSAWNLGVIDTPGEAALNAFVKRQTTAWNGGQGGDDLRFLTPLASDKVIEALKAMMTREAGVCWDSYPSLSHGTLINPAARIIEAQWVILEQAGGMTDSVQITIMSICGLETFPGLVRLNPAQANQVIQALGELVRKLKKGE